MNAVSGAPRSTADPLPAAATTAPASSAPASSSLPGSAIAQVDGSVRWMLQNGSQEAQLQLHPDSLGQITIALRVEGGAVHARLWVSEPGSMQAVQDGRSHLEQSLREQGLQLGSFDLHQGQRPFQESSARLPSEVRETPAPSPARQETPAPTAPSPANPHQIECYA
jgi:flagellar hook-length control protein FliK